MKDKIGAHILIDPQAHDQIAADYPMLKDYFRTHAERGLDANISGKIVDVQELRHSPESHMIVVDVAPNSTIMHDERYIIIYPSEISKMAGPF